MVRDILKQVWPEWQIEEKPIGRGAFGVVYKAVRNDSGFDTFAAIKAVTIPLDSSEIDSLRSEGLDINATKTYLKGIVDDFVDEIQAMESLKGLQNIVSIEDYKVVERTDEIGWYIFIRMELLTTFNTHICDKKLTESDVIKLGCDICTALEICGKRSIIHRDIKPENIFINDFGDYKLGDFGIARKLENLTGMLSQNGTYNYMPPEVVTSRNYDPSLIDTYSLGIVLYRMLNSNRLPFLDTEKQILNPAEKRNAAERRIRGELLPPPCEASPEMADLILRACAYNPEMRFKSASEMKQALVSVANGRYQIGTSRLDKTMSVRRAADSYDETAPARKASAAANQKDIFTVDTFGFVTKKKSSMPAVIVAVLAVVFFAGAGYFGLPKLFDYIDSIWSKEISDMDTSENAVYSKLDEEQWIASIISEAENLAAEEDYDGALVKIQTGLVTYPKSAELQDKADEYTKVLNAQVKAKTLDEAKTFADSGDYVSAIVLIKSVQESRGDDLDCRTALGTYSNEYKTEVIVSVDALAAGGDYIGALEAVRAASAVIGEDSELSAKSSEFENEYVKSVLISADEALNSGDIHGADKLLEVAQSVVPNNPELVSKSAEIKKLKPVSLSKQTLIDSNKWSVNDGDATDIFGNTHYSGYTSVIYNDNSVFGDNGYMAEYRIYRQFTTITGTISPYKSIEKATVRIIADDAVIQAFEVGKKTDPIQFSLDVTDVDYIRFEVDLLWRSGVIISDVELSNIPADNSVTSIMPPPPAGSYSPDKAVSLSKQKLIDSNDWSVNDGDATDIFGNTHYSAYTSVIYNDNSVFGNNGYMAEYRIYKQFTTLTGIISPYKSIENATVRIIADDAVIQAFEVGKKTDPVPFSLDVTDVDYIRFEVDLLWRSGVIISDVELR